MTSRQSENFFLAPFSVGVVFHFQCVALSGPCRHWLHVDRDDEVCSVI